MSKNNHVNPAAARSCTGSGSCGTSGRSGGLLGWRLICLPKMIINNPYEKNLEAYWVCTWIVFIQNIPLHRIPKPKWPSLVPTVKNNLGCCNPFDARIHHNFYQEGLMRIHRAVYWMSICMLQEICAAHEVDKRDKGCIMVAKATFITRQFFDEQGQQCLGP